MVEKRTPPKPNPKPIRPKNGTRTANDAPAIAADEVFAKEIITEIGEEVCDLFYPGAGRIFSLVFSWFINSIKRMLKSNVLRGNESGFMEDEQEQEQEDDTLNAEKER